MNAIRCALTLTLCLGLAARTVAADTDSVESILKQREAKTVKTKKLLNTALVKINAETIKKLETLLETETKAGRKKQAEEIKTIIAKMKSESEAIEADIEADDDAATQGKDKTKKKEEKEESKKSEIVYPAGTFEWSGHKYYLLPEAMKVEDAIEACEKLGGHLLSIENQEELDYFQGIALEKGQELWIDLKEGPAGKWKNGKGEEAKFIKWAPKQPTAGKDGVVINTAQHKSFAGMETRFSTEREVVCEWEP